MGSTQQSWEQIVSQKLAARDQLLAPYLVDDIEQRVPRVLQVDQRSCLEKDPQVQKITDLDNIVDLLQLLQKGDLTATEVVTAYIKRAVVAHQLVI
jgi:hypothetical protein